MSWQVIHNNEDGSLGAHRFESREAAETDVSRLGRAGIAAYLQSLPDGAVCPATSPVAVGQGLAPRARGFARPSCSRPTLWTRLAHRARRLPAVRPPLADSGKPYGVGGGHRLGPTLGVPRAACA